MYIPGKSPTSFGAAYCDFCRQPIPYLDFGEGRAAVISGKNCCAACADDGAWIRAGSAVPPGVLQRRATPRYLPSSQCELIIRLRGVRGIFGGNLNLRWLDVSEGGLRAVIRRECRTDERLSARIVHRPRGKSYRVALLVRHVRNSAQFPEGYVTGAQFLDPSPEFLGLIRRLHSPEMTQKQDSPTAGAESADRAFPEKIR
jgi:hypothetical protein